MCPRSHNFQRLLQRRCANVCFLFTYFVYFQLKLELDTHLQFHCRREIFDEEGWLHTGDIGCWLPGGRLKIIDRYRNQASPVSRYIYIEFPYRSNLVRKVFLNLQENQMFLLQCLSSTSAGRRISSSWLKESTSLLRRSRTFTFAVASFHSVSYTVRFFDQPMGRSRSKLVEIVVLF